MTRRAVLIISSVDPSGRAGLLADLRTVYALGCDAVVGVAALTAQTDERVIGVCPQSASILCSQIEAAASSATVLAVKIGLLPTVEIVRAVAGEIRALALRNIVVDPVFRSSSGFDLAGIDVPSRMLEELLPLVDAVTPNLLEASVLTGRPVTTPEQMQVAAQQLLCSGVRSVVIKGGHLPGSALDLYADKASTTLLDAPRVEPKRTRGTGCVFASAVAAGLARGESRLEAVKAAKSFTLDYISGAM